VSQQAPAAFPSAERATLTIRKEVGGPLSWSGCSGCQILVPSESLASS